MRLAVRRGLLVGLANWLLRSTGTAFPSSPRGGGLHSPCSPGSNPRTWQTFLAWLLARQRFIKHLELDIRHASWLEPAGTIIILLALSLKTLKLA